MGHLFCMQPFQAGYDRRRTCSFRMATYRSFQEGCAVTSSYFTDQQIELLLKPVHPNRVAVLRGLSYLEGYDVRAELNRVFGFGRWSEETTDQQLICETETKTSAGKAAW